MSILAIVLFIGFFVIDWMVFMWTHHMMQHVYASHDGFVIKEPFVPFFVIGTSFIQDWGFTPFLEYRSLHRLHHMHTDHCIIENKEYDPHSPSHEGGFFRLIFVTISRFWDFSWHPDTDLVQRLFDEGNASKKPWYKWDRIANNGFLKSFFFMSKILLLWWLLPEGMLWLAVTYVLLRLTWLSIQGAVVNRFGHHVVSPSVANALKQGELSRNFGGWAKPFIRLFTMYESQHGFHHDNPTAVNYLKDEAKKDLAYRVLLLFEKIGVVDLKGKGLTANL